MKSSSPTSTEPSRRTGWWPVAVFAAGVCSALVGVAVLAGWSFQVPVLKSILPGLVSMKPNTALAFVLAGTALALLAGTPVSRRQASAGQWLALVVALIGGLTLGEFLFGWQLGIDELLFKDDPDPAATLIPGRMAPSTAVCFVLLGLALMWIEWEPRRDFRPAEVLALVVGILSLSSLVEYAVGQPILYQFSQYTRMALNTAVVFIVLSAGVLLARPAQGVVGALRSGRVSPWERAVYAAMGLALLGVLAGGAWFYRAQEQQVQREVEVDLEAIAWLKVDQIAQWRAERLEDAAVLMGSQFFAEGVVRWMADPQADLGEKILARLRSMSQHNRYSDILLVDAYGQVRLRPSGRTDALAAPELESLATAFRTRQPVLSDLHTEPVGLPPHANLIAPLFQKTGADLQPIGAVVFEIEARQYLYPLIQSWPTASRSAETLLVRREGDSVLFLNELRHRPDTMFKLRVPLARREVPAVMAVLGKEGVLHGMDYRGVKVLSVLKHIPDTSWCMVAKVDEAEALAEWRFRAGLIVAVVVAVVLALAAAVCMIWAEQKKYRALSESAAALRKANRAYRVLSECNQALVRATDESALLQEVCRIVVEHGGYRFAWIGYAEQNEAKTVRPLARTGIEEGYLERLNVTWADTERGRGPIGVAIRTGQPNVAQDILHDPRFEPWRAEALQRGYAASVALPLTGQGRTFGVLSVYATEAHAFDEQELKLLAELAGDVAFGIVTLRLRAEHERQEQALRASRERYQLLFDAMLDGFALHEIICDPEGHPCDYRFLEVNPAFERLTGLKASEILGRTVLQVLPDTEPVWIETYGRVALTGESTRFENHTLALKKHFEVVAFSPRPNQFATIFADITERKRAEDALRKSEVRFKALADTSPLAIYVSVGLDQKAIYINATFVRLFGYTLEEVPTVAQWWPLAYPDEDYRKLISEEWNQKVARAIETRSDIEPMEVMVNCKDGAKKNILWGFKTSGEVNWAFGFDLTERKRVEAALERASAYNRTLIEASLDPLVTIGPDGKIMDVNEASAQVTGVPRERLIGTDFSDYFTEPEKAREGYRRVFAEGFVRDYPLAIRHVSGRVTDVLYNASVYKDTQGNVLGVFAAARDITERKWAQEEINKLNADLERRVQVRTAALHASENRYRRLFEAAKDGILILEAETGMVVDVNPFLIELLAFSREAFLGKKVWELGFFKDIVANQANFAELQQKEYIRYEDMALETADGRRIEVEFISNVHQVNDRKVIQCNIRDITARKQSEAALREAHELLLRRAAELEAFNRAMVDREQRIIEMKEEVNALCQELGRDPEYPPVWRKGP